LNRLLGNTEQPKAQLRQRILGKQTRRNLRDQISHWLLMSDYDLRPGGSLKLKGVAEGGVVKK
jgi:hypothetical protein